MDEDELRVWQTLIDDLAEVKGILRWQTVLLTGIAVLLGLPLAVA